MAASWRILTSGSKGNCFARRAVEKGKAQMLSVRVRRSSARPSSARKQPRAVESHETMFLRRSAWVQHGWRLLGTWVVSPLWTALFGRHPVADVIFPPCWLHFSHFDRRGKVFENEERLTIHLLGPFSSSVLRILIPLKTLFEKGSYFALQLKGSTVTSRAFSGEKARSAAGK